MAKDDKKKTREEGASDIDKLSSDAAKKIEKISSETAKKILIKKTEILDLLDKK